MVIWNQQHLKRHVPRSLLHGLLEFDIQFHRQLNHGQLDLVACEETAGTCIPAISERSTFQIASSFGDSMHSRLVGASARKS